MSNYSNENKMTILVIDDSLEIQKLIKISLEMIKGWTVITVDSGLKGIEVAYNKKNLDLIILDYLIPDITGEQVIKKLRNNQKTDKIPVIFLTAEYNRIAWKKMGAKGIIYKPFNPLNLGDLIEDML